MTDNDPGQGWKSGRFRFGASNDVSPPGEHEEAQQPPTDPVHVHEREKLSPGAHHIVVDFDRLDQQ